MKSKQKKTKFHEIDLSSPQNQKEKRFDFDKENTIETKKEDFNNNIFELADNKSKSFVANDQPKRSSRGSRSSFLKQDRGSSFNKSFASPDRRQSILEGFNFRKNSDEPAETVLVTKTEYIFYYGNQHSSNNSNLKVDIKGDFNGWKKQRMMEVTMATAPHE